MGGSREDGGWNVMEGRQMDTNRTSEKREVASRNRGTSEVPTRRSSGARG